MANQLSCLFSFAANEKMILKEVKFMTASIIVSVNHLKYRDKKQRSMDNIKTHLIQSVIMSLIQ